MQLPPRNASRELASLLQINGEITSALHYVQVSNLVFLIVNTTGTGEEDEQVGYVQLLAFMLAAFVFFFFTVGVQRQFAGYFQCCACI